MHTKFPKGKSERNRAMRLDGIIFKWVLKKSGVREWNGLNWLRK
jgi:hypothetical protein